MEVEPVGQQHGHMATGRCQNSSKAITSAILEAFTGWLRHSYAPYLVLLLTGICSIILYKLTVYEAVQFIVDSSTGQAIDW